MGPFARSASARKRLSSVFIIEQFGHEGTHAKRSSVSYSTRSKHNPFSARRFLLATRRALGRRVHSCEIIDSINVSTFLWKTSPENWLGSNAIKNCPLPTCLPSSSVNEPISVPRLPPANAAQKNSHHQTDTETFHTATWRHRTG